jgi:hypothetical protein
LDQGLNGTDADVLKGDGEEASPYALAPMPGQRERGPLGQINVTAPDRLLKQGRRDPWVDRERSLRSRSAKVIFKQMRNFGSVHHGSSLGVRRPVEHATHHKRMKYWAKVKWISGGTTLKARLSTYPD